jgi:hypothetical protein
LLRPIGLNEPGDVVDVDARFGVVLVREGFAHPVEGEARQRPETQAPTLRELRSFAADRGVGMGEARRMMAAERASTKGD